MRARLAVGRGGAVGPGKALMRQGGWLLLAGTIILGGFAGADAKEWQKEKLGRGVVAVRSGPSEVFVSWRLLEKDPDGAAFRVYRLTGGKEPVLRNTTPLDGATSLVDRFESDAVAPTYVVRLLEDGEEQAASRPAAVWENGYLEIPIVVPDGYRAGDASVGDLDGDGRYEIVLHQVSRPRDNSHAGLTGTPVLDAYTLDGKRLWRIDLGKNIREGEHYTQFLVYDFDGDGRAEVACKTADGSRDGVGNVIGDESKDWRELDPEARSYGRILRGPEYLSVFDGLTGRALATVDYVPGRDPIDGWGGIGGNGGNDDYGNRCDRFLACVAYLDGERPSAVMCRGVYGRTVLAAWDWRDGTLRKRWVYDSGISYPPYRDASRYSGMGGHSLAVADVDGDGRDEVVYQAMVIDDDGTELHSSGLRHGDAMHVSDFDPSRPGQEIFTVQENEGRTIARQTPGAALRNARTGKILWSHSSGVDVGGGLAADIDPRHHGAEMWGGPGGLRTAQGTQIGKAPRTDDFAIWWDGDLLRELVGWRGISKWDWLREREEPLLELRRSRRSRWPCLVGDLLGDWREEMVVASPDGESLRLYTTTIPTDHRRVSLLEDRQYRLALAWQNVVYNKPPHPGFYLGSPPPGSE